ncbi:fimbria/pilus outer membrane usher protein [Entomohabitans teleogrylli]|uniref:fimbria/pilus outer membrane usher protein n=1 Tax=Entomohabitans teleogrylli TaxID=1384589 RepID=UPI00073D749E|nr:fimbria/pilus outer membrane usher protein [Entomohabitans teleogrylli]
MEKPVLINKYKLLLSLLILFSGVTPAWSDEFNTDLLDAEDKNNLDLSRFSTAGYVMPGSYTLSLLLNNKSVTNQEITVRASNDQNNENAIDICLTKEQTGLLGLKDSALAKVIFDANGQCADFSALEGLTLRVDLTSTSLYISVPQIWLEYQDASWLPPSRWEDGLAGVLLDYNLNFDTTRYSREGQTQNISGSGTLGANLGAWRLRGDWQGRYNHASGGSDSSQRNVDWSRIYAYRALRDIGAKLTLGEDYLYSDLFDSWRYTGASLMSDETMLPPKLRGYAPEVSGIARTNAKVIISQQGRVIHETTVAAGPFRIQDLNSAVNGQLDVRVEEQDGSVQTFQVTTATIPYLTRPGQVRYKVAAGRPGSYDRHMEGPMFATGELSWGVTNSWSLYSGGIFSSDYLSIAAGVGRDLFRFGALSADVTQSVAKKLDDGTKQGRSYRVSYSKRFEEFNSDITFAGYRFSERDYMSMSDYLDARYHGGLHGNNKELYTITASKNFTDARLSAYLSWSHQTYWDLEDTDRYSFSVSRYFDLGDWRNMAGSLSVSRSEYKGKRDNTAWLNLSIPFGKGTASYNGNWSNDRYSQTASWYQRLNDKGDSYQLTAGSRTGGNGESATSQASAWYSHNGALADVTANISWQESSYTALGLTLNGGVTATREGAALHGGSSRGGTRMMVGTNGVAGVPVGISSQTNRFGVAVIPSIPSYYRTSTEINVNRLPDDIETAGSPVSESALTEGAIGFREFNVLKGQKGIATIGKADGSFPPFGASVRNSNNIETGMIGDHGSVWLSGISPGEKLTIWSGDKQQCEVVLPEQISHKPMTLICR